MFVKPTTKWNSDAQMEMFSIAHSANVKKSRDEENSNSNNGKFLSFSDGDVNHVDLPNNQPESIIDIDIINYDNDDQDFLDEQPAKTNNNQRHDDETLNEDKIRFKEIQHNLMVDNSKHSMGNIFNRKTLINSKTNNSNSKMHQNETMTITNCNYLNSKCKLDSPITSTTNHDNDIVDLMMHINLPVDDKNIKKFQQRSATISKPHQLQQLTTEKDYKMSPKINAGLDYNALFEDNPGSVIITKNKLTLTNNHFEPTRARKNKQTSAIDQEDLIVDRHRNQNKSAMRSSTNDLVAAEVHLNPSDLSSVENLRPDIDYLNENIALLSSTEPDSSTSSSSLKLFSGPYKKKDSKKKRKRLKRKSQQDSKDQLVQLLQYSTKTLINQGSAVQKIRNLNSDDNPEKPLLSINNSNKLDPKCTASVITSGNCLGHRFSQVQKNFGSKWLNDIHNEHYKFESTANISTDCSHFEVFDQNMEPKQRPLKTLSNFYPEKQSHNIPALEKRLKEMPFENANAQKLSNRIPLGTMMMNANTGGQKLNSGYNSQILKRGHYHHNHYDPIDNYPTSPFGHSTCDSQKTFDINSSNINVKFPKLKYLKVCLLSLLVIYTLVSFIFIREKKETWTNVAVQDKLPAYIDLSQSLDLMFPVWKLRSRGSFLPKEYGHLTNYSIIFTIVQLFNESTQLPQQQSYRVVKRPWAAPIAPTNVGQYIPAKEIEHTFKLTRGDFFDQNYRYRLRIDTNSKESIGITVTMSGFSELSADGIILAASVLIFLYVLIIFEIVNRTLAAMLGATAAITCLTLIRDRPSLAKVVSWLDVETLSLLFGMMILVAILCETGFFDYIAVVAFRLAKGRTWPLIFTLCIFTGVMSAFLDNVTTILLMTPVTIRLCEIKNIEPKHVLISLVIISNIGGAATPVGDPPNVIIISSASIQQQGINFGRFTMHMMPGIILSFIATLIYIRIYYKNFSNTEFQDTSTSNEDDTEENLNEFKKTNEPSNKAMIDNLFSCNDSRMVNITPIFSSSDHQETIFGNNEPQIPSQIPLKSYPSCTNLEDLCAGNSYKDHLLDERRVFRSSDELKREIEVWKRACNSIVGYSRDENSVRTMLNRKVETLETILRQHCYETVPPEDNYRSVLLELEEKYKIRDWPLLIKSVVVMSMVIGLFFMQSIPDLDLSLGWIAILGAILLLVVSDRYELESIMSRVEWSTLIFFAALFVVMEALAELKFLWWIGQLTQDFINSVPEQSRLVVAILVFMWISALSSSFIDNIPLTTVMVKIIEDLAENNEFNIPLVPLIYALAFGACLGGNGTLIGASSNVVCSGVAEQHGYRFTFFDFFKIGFPIMLLTVAISTIYLIICHVVFQWNY